jgi:hypothetical protein
VRLEVVRGVHGAAALRQAASILAGGRTPVEEPSRS